jgi:hypothetical protein
MSSSIAVAISAAFSIYHPMNITFSNQLKVFFPVYILLMSQHNWNSVSAEDTNKVSYL